MTDTRQKLALSMQRVFRRDTGIDQLLLDTLAVSDIGHNTHSANWLVVGIIFYHIATTVDPVIVTQAILNAKLNAIPSSQAQPAVNRRGDNLHIIFVGDIFKRTYRIRFRWHTIA